VCTALLVPGIALAAAPCEGAAASPENAADVNAAATHAYLVAMNSFGEAELRSQPQDVAATEATAARVSRECPGVLTGAPPDEDALGPGLTGVPSQSAPSARETGERSRQSRQLEDLKLELLFTLESSRTQPEREAETTLVRALMPLKWTDPEITFLVHFTAETFQEELDLPTPPVCADMNAWVASGYKMLSPASKEAASHSEALLKRSFELIGIGTQTHIEPLPKALAPYESASDRTLARHIEALSTRLRKGNETQAGIVKRLEATIGLPPSKAETRKVKRPVRKPAVIAHGRTAAGGRFVAKAERSSHPGLGCAVLVMITEASRPREELQELLSGEGTGRCLSRSQVEPKPTVHCKSGLLTVEANLLPATRSVRLTLSDGSAITTPAIRVPPRLGGPAGLYYQVVRGPSPIPVSLTELGAQGNVLTTLKLPAVVECTKHPVKYFPDGIVRLVHESPPQIPAFTIRGERYRKLGAVHFELKLEVSNEELLFGGGGEELIPEGRLMPGESERTRRMFTPRASSGCQPQPYAIVYGLLKARGDTVLARVSGQLVPLREVLIPARLHAGGVLVYGAFSPLPTELLVRDARGTTIDREDLAQNADSVTETCEGEAE